MFESFLWRVVGHRCSWREHAVKRSRQACRAALQDAKSNVKRSGARRLKFDKDGGRSKLVKGRFEIDMDEFGVDRDVIRTSSARSMR